MENRKNTIWNGALKNVVEFCNQLKRDGKLTATDKKLFETNSRAYYRWFNDGDFPNTIKGSGYGRQNCDELISLALEWRIIEILKKLIKKYKK
jgi:hypothetical protein